MESIAPEQSRPAFWDKTFPNRLPALMRAIEELSAFLVEQNVSPQALHTAQLALEEMGTNVIKYGFDDQEEHPMTLRARCEGTLIELDVIDSGHVFDPSLVPEPNREASLDERMPGGWGISLVRKLVKEMVYERVDGHNVLTLRILKV